MYLPNECHNRGAKQVHFLVSLHNNDVYSIQLMI